MRQHSVTSKCYPVVHRGCEVATPVSFQMGTEMVVATKPWRLVVLNECFDSPCCILSPAAVNEKIFAAGLLMHRTLEKLLEMIGPSIVPRLYRCGAEVLGT